MNKRYTRAVATKVPFAFLEPGYPLNSGKYFYRPEGRHCPDYRDDLDLAREVLQTMLGFAMKR